MADGVTAPRPTLSSTSRLVEAGVWVAEACSCAPQARRLILVRGFDGRSRTQAQELRSRLRQHGIDAADTPGPLLASDPSSAVGNHVCAYIRIGDAAAELDRISALTRTPLIALPPGEGATDLRSDPVPVMRAEWTAADHSTRIYPSAVGRVPDVAFETFLVVPNQPETGELTLRVAEAGVRYLPSGTSIDMRCMSGGILIEAIDPTGVATTWLGRTAEVREYAGIHRVFRDGLSIADLAPGIRVEYDDAALQLHWA